MTKAPEKIELCRGPVADGAPLVVWIDGVISPVASHFDQAGQLWREWSKELNGDPSAVLAHTASAAPNNSDLGVVLAWFACLREGLSQGRPIKVQTNDPWIYRCLLASFPVIETGTAPALALPELKLWLRGMAARLRFALRTALKRRPHRPQWPDNAPAMIAYGHPASSPDGHDGYFGDLLKAIPRLKRIVHVDATPQNRQHLCADGSSADLESWGSRLYALLRLSTARWVPRHHDLQGPLGWLIRRAAALEGSRAQGAAIAWQIHCQKRWLHKAKPKTVVWPWENHGWERALVAEARKLGIRTIGHQHSVIGQQFNIGCLTLEDLPDIVAANGPSGFQQLERRGVPVERMTIAGTLRFKKPADGGPVYDPNGPIFLAVPFDHRVAGQMIDALRPVAASGLTVLMRDHPLFPVAFEDSANFHRAPGPLPSMDAVRCVIFAATTVGLESLLAGLPTIRFIPSGCVAVDILPDFVPTPTANAATVLTAVLDAVPPPPLHWTDVFAEPDLDFWRRQLT